MHTPESDTDNDQSSVQGEEVDILEIIDNSAKHKGHTGVENSSTTLTHVELRVLNKNNLNKIDIHRTIHEKLDSVFKFGLHSLEIKISNR